MGKILRLWVTLTLGILIAGESNGQFTQDDMATDLAEALTFTKYPTYPQYLEMMQYFAESYPEICRLDTFGTSVEGRLLLAVKISDNVEQNEAEASFLYTSTIHGNELVGYPLMLRLISYLLEGYGEDPEVDRLVDGLEIWINPLANPDGTFSGGDFTAVEATRENSQGVDLNRNFPDISIKEADNESGRALENQHMMRFLREKRFTLSANIHSGAEVVNYPWDWTYDRHPDDHWFQLISREYADEVHSIDPRYMTMEDNGITNGANWYIIHGSRQDYISHFLGGREVTLELGYDFLLDSDSLESFWKKNERSLLYYITQASYGIRGQVSGGPNNLPVEAKLSIEGHDDSTSVIYSNADHGDFYRLIKAGTYDVSFSSEGYQTKTIPGVKVEDFQTTFLYPVLDSIAGFAGPEKGSLSARLYPNPANDRLFIDLKNQSSGPINLKIYTSTGCLVGIQQLQFNGSIMEVPIHHLRDGIYFLQLSTQKQTGAFRFVIQ